MTAEVYDKKIGVKLQQMNNYQLLQYCACKISVKVTGGQTERS